MTSPMYEPSRRTPAEELRRARLKADLEQVELAQLIGCSSKTISRWENGHSEPSITEWRAIAAATRAPWLLSGEETVTYWGTPAVVENAQERLPMQLPPATTTPLLAVVE